MLQKAVELLALLRLKRETWSRLLVCSEEKPIRASSKVTTIVIIFAFFIMYLSLLNYLTAPYSNQSIDIQTFQALKPEQLFFL